MKKIVFVFAAVSILTSFITRTFGESGVLARIAFADLFGALSIVFFILSGAKLLVTNFLRASIILLATFAVGLFETKALDATITEILILFFLMMSFAVIYSLYKSEDGFYKLIKLVIYTAIATSFVGFYGFVANIVGLPDIFSDRATGEVLSGFRDAGQAGAYALVMLAILMPFKSSVLAKKLDKRHLFLLNVAIISTILFLFLTGKIAAYIGFVFSLLFSALQKRKIGNFISILFIAGIIAVVWFNLQSISPDVYNRINSKYESRITANISGENDITEQGFFAQNYGGAMRVFEAHPLTGSGIGGYYTVYDNYEVHSTYFKLLGETGFVGTVGYIYFIIVLFTNFKGVSKSKRTNPYASYLWHIIPFLLGCFISWGYTYHLRKREFWILCAVICIASYLRRLTETKLQANELINAQQTVTA